MAVSSVISRTRDLNKPTTIEPLAHVLAMGDSQGDMFQVAVTNGSIPLDISFGACTGWFVRLEEGKKIEDCSTVALTGSVSSNVATIILPEACYVTPGRFIFTMYVTLSGVRHAVYISEGLTARTSTTAIVDPGHNIPDINELLAKLGEMEAARASAQAAADSANVAAGAANSAAESANAAAGAANTAAGSVNSAISEANALVDKWDDISVEYNLLPASEDPYARLEQTEHESKFIFGLPNSDLSYSTFYVDDDMNLVMDTPEDFSDFTFSLKDDGHLYLEVL